MAHCGELVDGGELVLALDRLDLLDMLLSGKVPLDDSNNLTWLNTVTPRSLTSLRELKALGPIEQEMQHLRLRIGKGFEARFVNSLLVDLRQHIKTVMPQDTLQRWSAASHRWRGDIQRPHAVLPAYTKVNNQIRQDLTAWLVGLHRCRCTQQATAAFRDGIVEEINVLIRKRLLYSTDDDHQVSAFTEVGSHAMSQQDKSAMLAKNLRELDPNAAEELCVNVYTDIGEALRRLRVQVKVLLDVTSDTANSSLTTPEAGSPMPSLGTLSNTSESLSFETSPPILSHQSQDELTQAHDLSSLLGQAVDTAQTQIIKVLKVRSEQAVRLPFTRFLRYFHMNRLFVDECEAVSGRSGAALKDLINKQIGEFILLFGVSMKQELVSAMDADKWEAKDFGPDDEAMLGRLLQGMTSDHEDWVRTSAVWERLEGEPFDPIDLKRGGTGPPMNNLRTAIIDEQSNILIGSAITALRGIDQLAQLIVGIPGMTLEATNILLDFLKLFNSRSCQLILGTGARHSAGLKNINSKHLALVSQALGFFIALMPYLREFVRRHAMHSPSLAEFDKVKRLYQDHQVNIHNKLIDIMSSRMTAHISTMEKIDWDADAREISAYMETLTGETRKLHKVLSKHLPESTVTMIIGPVMQSYKEQLGKAFNKAVVKTPEGKARLLRDAGFFNTQLKKIEGASEVGCYLAEIVNKKQINGVGKSDDIPTSLFRNM